MSVKMRTTCTWTERPYEALLFPEIGFGPFPTQLRWKAKKAPFRGGPSHQLDTTLEELEILTLCQHLRAKGQSQVDSFYGA